MSALENGQRPRPLRVLLLLHEMTLTGAPRVAMEAFTALRAAGKVEVQPVALHGGPMEQECYERFGALWVVSGEGQPSWRRAIRLARRPSRRSALLNRFRPDLIYVNSVASLPLADLLGLPATGIPALLHVHELETHINHYARILPNLLTPWPRRYIAVSGAVRAALIRDHEIPAERISSIPAFTRIPEAPPPTTPVTPAPGTPFVVGGCGKGMWRKGMESWLRMAVALSRRLGEDAVRFVWVGVTDDRDGLEFRETARKLGVDHLIDFVPVTKEPLKHFARFDAFAMTSWEEPFGLVVLEAMAMEKPVACFSGSGGPAEVVGETGVVIPDFDPNLMADALAALAAQPEKRREMGQAARARVLAQYSLDVLVPKLEAAMRAAAADDDATKSSESGAAAQVEEKRGIISRA